MSEEEKQPVLNENTKFNMWLVVILVGGVVWLTNFTALAQNTATQLFELKEFIYADLRIIKQELKEIRDRLPPK